VSGLPDAGITPDEVIDWTRSRGLRLNAGGESLIRLLVEQASQHESLTGLLAAAEVPDTSARFRMHKKRLPPPSRWFQLARALHAVALLRAERDTDIATIARALGYSDHSALSQLTHRAFGLRPGLTRYRPGWEWLLDRWLALHGTPGTITAAAPMRRVS
jgi:AraC-like DNA-binding protein